MITLCILVAAYIVGVLVETLTQVLYTGHLQGQRLAEYYGFIACGCLALVLAARIWAPLVRGRRGLGLAVFAYSVVHTGLTFEHVLGGRWEGIDFLSAPERWATWTGFAALGLMVPLVLTSTDFWVRRLGQRWRQLHRLVFPVALLALVHALWLGASDWPGRLLLVALALGVLVVRIGPARFGEKDVDT